MTFKSFKHKVSNNHQLHVELAGNPNGIPVLFIHGGPGAGINGSYQWPFDLDTYFVIAYDQRGCGQSQPFADIKHNSSQALIADIESIRQYLKIERWALFGGSWGATLALLYAIEHPDRTSHIVLRGTFLGREEDYAWFLSPTGAAAQVFPKEYANFVKGVDCKDSWQCIADSFYARMQSSDPNISQLACEQWFSWEVAISKLVPDKKTSPNQIASNLQMKSLALLECHYIHNRCFIEENHVINNAYKITHIPIFIIHGRYDLVCKVDASIKLHEHLHNSTLSIIDSAGHSAQEIGIKKNLLRTMKHIAKNISTTQ